MKMPQVILWEHYISKRRKWIMTSLMIFISSMIIVVLMFHQTMAYVTRSHIQGQIAPYKAKEDIYKILLSNSDIVLGDAMEIAQTVIDQSNKTQIPVALFLAMMKKESNFSVNAVSPVKAMGIMQIHPITWDTYVKKLDLKVSRKDAFVPSLNITVSAAILCDLRDRYQKQGYEDPLLWDYVLSAYYAGPESVKEGLNPNHRQYVERVRKYARELSKVIES